LSIAIKALNKIINDFQFKKRPFFEPEIKCIVENAKKYEIDKLTNKAPHTQAAIIVYLVTQLSTKFNEKKEEITEILINSNSNSKF